MELLWDAAKMHGVQLLPFLKVSLAPKSPPHTHIRVRGEPLNAGEAGPEEEVYTGERSDNIKWRESKGQRKCILIECLQWSVPPLKRPLPARISMASLTRHADAPSNSHFQPQNPTLWTTRAWLDLSPFLSPLTNHFLAFRNSPSNSNAPSDHRRKQKQRRLSGDSSGPFLPSHYYPFLLWSGTSAHSRGFCLPEIKWKWFSPRQTKIYTCIHKKKGLLDVNIMSLMKSLDGLQARPFRISVRLAHCHRNPNLPWRCTVAKKHCFVRGLFDVAGARCGRSAARGEITLRATRWTSVTSKWKIKGD